MVNYPLVSIIMPAFNSERFITAAILSVLKQDYKNWELFIIDDCSTDATIAIVKKIAANESRIHLVINNTNVGPGRSRNRGIKKASGEFISFLDADDLWRPEKLSKQLDFAEKNNADVVFCSYDRIDETGNSMQEIVMALPKVDYHKLLRSNYIGNLTGIYKVAAVGKIMAPEIRKRQDWAMWLQVLRGGRTAYGMPDRLAFYRVRKASISSNKIEMLTYNFRIYHQILGFNKIKSLYWMFLFLVEHFFVKSRQLKTSNSGSELF